MMKTIGSVLRDARMREGLSLEDLSERTKIRKNFLAALEENNFPKLPSETVARGFIQVYAREVGLDQKSALALFRRDFSSGKDGEIVPHEMLEPISTRRSIFQRARWTFVVVAVFLTLAVGFIAYQWISVSTVPAVSVVEPKENQEVRSPVVVRGRTATDVTVTVNGKQTALDQDGVFQTNVEFDAGEHTITVEIRTRRGKTKLVQRTVRVVE